MKNFITLTLLLCLIQFNCFSQDNSSNIGLKSNQQIYDSKTGWFYNQNEVDVKSEQFFKKFKSVFLLSNDDRLEEYKTIEDQLGFSHTYFQQFYKNLEVEGGNYILHSKNNIVVKGNGKVISGLDIEIKPKIKKEIALKIALEYDNNEKYIWQDDAGHSDTNHPSYPEPDLIITFKSLDNLNSNNFVLAYKIILTFKDGIKDKITYVNANTGEIIRFAPLACTAFHHEEQDEEHNINSNDTSQVEKNQTTTSLGSESILPLSCPSCPNCVDVNYPHFPYNNPNALQRVTFENKNNNQHLYGNCRNNTIHTGIYISGSRIDDTYLSPPLTLPPPMTRLPYAVQMHWGTEMFYDYFENTHNHSVFGRTSDGLIRNLIRRQTVGHNIFYSANPISGNRYQTVNINWPSLASKRFETSLDAMGHEWTHNLIHRSANLFYFGESGALNESFSDIFGVMTEFYAENLYDVSKTGDWLFGEDIGNGAVRNMSNPSASTGVFEMGNRCPSFPFPRTQPDTYLGNNWFDYNAYPLCDHGGVHINSGVQNYWFYLLSEGGSGINNHPTLPKAYSVCGIGKDKAAQIAYRNFTNYLTSGSSFQNARQGAINAAIDLFGDCSNEVIQTINAWDAVGVYDPNNNFPCNSVFTVFDQEVCRADIPPTGVQVVANPRPPINYNFTLPGYGTNSTGIFQIPSQDLIDGINNFSMLAIDQSTGCGINIPFQIIVNPSPSISLTINKTNIFLGDNVTLASNFSGGTPSYQFTWYLNGNLLPLTTSSITHAPLQAGLNTYKVTITDSKGCIDEATVDVNVQNCGDFLINPIYDDGGFHSITSPHLIQGNIVVTNGTTLFIENTTLYFDDCAIMLIENGGQVYMENATLRACLTKWKGVEVRGVSNEPDRFPGGPHGFISLNNSSIEDADIGILSGARLGNLSYDVSIPATGHIGRAGGIVQVNSSVFSNNMNDIAFTNYEFPHFGNSFINGSEFINLKTMSSNPSTNNFCLDESGANNVGPIYTSNDRSHIFIKKNIDIEINSNSFTGNTALDKIYGIRALESEQIKMENNGFGGDYGEGAGIYMEDCDNDNKTNQNNYSGTFNNGIEAIDCTMNPEFILNSTFDGSFYNGISMINCDDNTIIQNQFTGSASFGNNGMNVINSNNNDISNNTFTSNVIIGNNGILAENSDELTFMGNEIYSTISNTAFHLTDCNFPVFTSNTISSFDINNGIYLKNCEGASIHQGNQILNLIDIGIQVYPTQNHSTATVIRDNLIQGCQFGLVASENQNPLDLYNTPPIAYQNPSFTINLKTYCNQFYNNGLAAIAGSGRLTDQGQSNPPPGSPIAAGNKFGLSSNGTNNPSGDIFWFKDLANVWEYFYENPFVGSGTVDDEPNNNPQPITLGIHSVQDFANNSAFGNTSVIDPLYCARSQPYRFAFDENSNNPNQAIVKVQPNPFQNAFELNWKNQNTAFEVKIIDVMGKVIYQEQINNLEGNKLIETQKWQSCLYFLQIIEASGKASESFKLMKIK